MTECTQGEERAKAEQKMCSEQQWKNNAEKLKFYHTMSGEVWGKRCIIKSFLLITAFPSSGVLSLNIHSSFMPRVGKGVIEIPWGEG